MTVRRAGTFAALTLFGGFLTAPAAADESGIRFAYHGADGCRSSGPGRPVSYYDYYDGGRGYSRAYYGRSRHRYYSARQYRPYYKSRHYSRSRRYYGGRAHRYYPRRHRGLSLHFYSHR